MASQRAPAPTINNLPFPKWVLWLSLPGIIAPALIFVFILFSERAHDETRCPFREHERRELAAGIAVVEEARNCFRDVEERRFVVHRQGQTQVLGQRRFARAAFAPDVYSWKASLSAEGETHVRVDNRGHGEARFREGTAAEKAKWPKAP